MNKQVQAIIRNMQTVNDGEAWYGRPIQELLSSISHKEAAQHPGKNGHSALELLYHMVTWMEFTVKRLEHSKEMNIEETEQLDWRIIDPSIHDWEKGITLYQQAYNRIIALLQTRNDDFLKEIVDYRSYNFRVLLNGLVQHNIYHIGQIAYIKKYLL